jgi:hypothetical protein
MTNQKKTTQASSYSDSSTVGWYDEQRMFEQATGTPSPRQRAQRGESGFGEHVGPERSAEMIRRPLD